MTRSPGGALGLWHFDLLSGIEGLRHCVTSRQSGVSEGRYETLNLGQHVGDDPARVIENRRRVCEALGVEFGQLTLGQQVHGDRVHVVGAAEAGRGRERFDDGIPDCDGLIVREPGIAIGVFVADCVPMLLYDPEHRLAAAVHAGWRGTAAGIAGKAVRALEACGARPGGLIAGIGPAIGRCCYEVSDEVAEAVGVAERRAGAWYADLAEANRRQLLAAGVGMDRIEMSGLCTACHADEFFSERRLGRPTGRFGVFALLTAQRPDS